MPTPTRYHVLQAQRTAAFINGEPAATHVYSSDLMRCRQSAEAIATATGFPVTHDPRLRERALGQLEGMTRAEARARWDTPVSG